VAQPTWTTRELPILEAIAELESSGQKALSVSQLAARTGLSEREATNGFEALVDADYVGHGSRARNMFGWVVAVPRLREKGRRAIRQWPTHRGEEWPGRAIVRSHSPQRSRVAVSGSGPGSESSLS
jgi:hypothetical protein